MGANNNTGKENNRHATHAPLQVQQYYTCYTSNLQYTFTYVYEYILHTSDTYESSVGI